MMFAALAGLASLNISAQSIPSQSVPTRNGLTVQAPNPAARRLHLPHPGAQAIRAAANTQQAATPQFSVAGGSYADAQTVTITDSTPGATIYYETNGTYPGIYSAKYTAPVTVSTSEIVVAVAIADGYSNSDWGIAEYFITSVPTRFTYTVAGNGTWGNSGDGGPGPAARLGSPNSAIADDAGNVYIADQASNVVRKVDGKTGIISTIAGTGVAANSGDGGPATSAALWSPTYLLLDGSGHLYIGELGDYVVRRLDLATGQIAAFFGDANGGLGSMNGLAIDFAGNVYIGTGYNVLKVDIQSGNAAEYVGYSTTPGFQYNYSFALDSRGNVYGWIGNAIQKITPFGQVSIVAGKTSGGPFPANGGDGGPATSAYLGNNGFVAVDNQGNLYLADTGDEAVREVNTSGIINTIAGVFSNDYTVGGDGDPSSNAGLFYPGNLSVDSSGNVYLVLPVESRVIKVTAPVTPPTAATSAPTFSLTPGSYPDSQQVDITSSTPGAAIFITFDGSDPGTAKQAYHGTLDVTGSAAIKAIAVGPGFLKSSISSASYTVTAPPWAVISTFAGNGKFGFSASGGPATSTRIGEPTSVAVGSGGDAYIADWINSAIWKVGTSGNISLVAGSGTYGFSGDGGPAASAVLSNPLGVAVDKSGNVYIADTGNNRIRKIDAVTGIITTVVGGGSRTTTLGDGGLASQAWVMQPNAITFDASGNLYIADTGNGRVRFVDAKTGIITSIAGSSTNFPFQEGAPASQQNVVPIAIALDKSNNVYIADQWYGRVRKIDASTNIITTVAGGGKIWPGEGEAVATDILVNPRGVAVAADGTVYFADSLSIVRKVDPATGLLSTVAGNGYYGYSGDGGAASMASLNSPYQLTIDSAGSLFIADEAYVVRKVTFPAPAALPKISVPGGTYTTAQHITLTDSTAGSTIYYTLDGTVPDAGSTVYSGPLVLRQSATLQAAAAAPGHPLSAIAKSTYTITLQTPTVALSSSADTAFASNPVTFTATLTGASGTPTGTVTFLDGTTTLGTGTISSGAATYTTSSLSSGTHTVTAFYDGDDNFTVATSAAVTETIEDFSVGAPSSGSTSATVQPGGTATYTLSVTPPSGTKTPTDITFSVSGLPAGATGTFKPTTVLAGSGATNVTLSVAVPAQSGAAVRPASQGFPVAWGLLVLPLLGLRRSRRAMARTMLLLVLAVTSAIAIAGMSGCGGSGSQSGTTHQPQTYTLKVTATAGALSHTTNLTLTVE